MKAIDEGRGRLALASFWLVAFGACVAVLIVTHLRGDMGRSSFVAGIESVASLYAPYVGSVLAYVFAKHRAIGPRMGARASNSLSIALAVSLIWNLVIWTMIAQAVWEPIDNPMVKAIGDASDIGGKLSWLLAPVMGYYFAAGGAQASKR